MFIIYPDRVFFNHFFMCVGLILYFYRRKAYSMTVFFTWASCHAPVETAYAVVPACHQAHRKTLASAWLARVFMFLCKRRELSHSGLIWSAVRQLPSKWNFLH